eukprot:g16916.t1
MYHIFAVLEYTRFGFSWRGSKNETRDFEDKDVRQMLEVYGGNYTLVEWGAAEKAAAYRDLRAKCLASLNGHLEVVKALESPVIVSIGNPVLEITAKVPQETLDKYGLQHGEALSGDEQKDMKHDQLLQELEKMEQAKYVAGGATQNSIRVAQWMLQEAKMTADLGCVGDDAYGRRLTEVCQQEGVVTRYMVDPARTSTCAVAIVDKKRTSVARPGAHEHYKVSHLKEPENFNLLKSAKIVYCSGSLLPVSVESVELASKAPNLSCAEPIVVAVRGVISRHEVVPLSEEQIVDSYGAGDAFVGGFLAAMARKHSIAACCQAGSYAAATDSVSSSSIDLSRGRSGAGGGAARPRGGGEFGGDIGGDSYSFSLPTDSKLRADDIMGRGTAGAAGRAKTEGSPKPKATTAVAKSAATKAAAKGTLRKTTIDAGLDDRFRLMGKKAPTTSAPSASDFDAFLEDIRPAASPAGSSKPAVLSRSPAKMSNFAKTSPRPKSQPVDAYTSPSQILQMSDLVMPQPAKAAGLPAKAASRSDSGENYTEDGCLIWKKT